MLDIDNFSHDTFGHGPVMRSGTGEPSTNRSGARSGEVKCRDSDRHNESAPGWPTAAVEAGIDRGDNSRLHQHRRRDQPGEVSCAGRRDKAL
jgi:hypothetical protein